MLHSYFVHFFKALATSTFPFVEIVNNDQNLYNTYEYAIIINIHIRKL